MSKKAPLNCIDCGAELDTTNIRWNRPGTPFNRCRECYRKYRNDWYSKNKDKVQSRYSYRNANLKRNYGISLEEYNELSKLHQDRCAICRNKCITNQNLSVDHDHDTGQVRGLLCKNCNLALGYLKEDEDIIWNMMEYLKKYKWSKVA